MINKCCFVDQRIEWNEKKTKKHSSTSVLLGESQQKIRFVSLLLYYVTFRFDWTGFKFNQYNEIELHSQSKESQMNPTESSRIQNVAIEIVELDGYYYNRLF